MKTTKSLILSIVSLLVISTSCNKPDKTRPVIEAHTPENNSSFVQGGEIIVSATFTDDKELQQYKINIHSDYDSHSHSTLSAYWNEDFIGDLSGNNQTITRTLSIPEDATPGPYHLMLYCVDAAGNEARAVSIDVEILEKE
jgi:hypothetical protein